MTLKYHYLNANSILLAIDIDNEVYKILLTGYSLSLFHSTYASLDTRDELSDAYGNAPDYLTVFKTIRPQLTFKRSSTGTYITK